MVESDTAGASQATPVALRRPQLTPEAPAHATPIIFIAPIAAILALILALILLITPILAGTALAQTGKRNFIEPLVEEDANPSNSFDFIPQWIAYKHGYTTSMVYSLEKQMTPDFSIDVAGAWNDPYCDPNAVCDQIGAVRRGRGRRRHRRNSSQELTGFDDVEVLFKYAFLESDQHELRAAIGLDTFLPVGNPTAGGGTYTALGPIFMVSKGMGDIPNFDNFGQYLRPFAIQADIEYLVNTGGPSVSEPVGDWVVSYDLFYLDHWVHNFYLPEPFDHLVPFAEFTYDQIVKSRYSGTQPDLRVLPGFAYMRDTFQISVASALALNQQTVHDNHAGVEVMLSLVLDQIWPVMGEHPL